MRGRLRVWADYAHFSHPATIYSALSYPIPPKTTVAGMLGAIAGLDDYLALGRIRYSVVIKQLKGKQSYVFNGIQAALPSISLDEKVQKIKNRKQFYRELLVEPIYDIYLDFLDVPAEIAGKTIQKLSAHQSDYTVYLGVNFCLANFEWHPVASWQDKTGTESVMIDSFVPLNTEFELEAGKNYTDIRIPTEIDEGRIFGGFTDLLVETSAKEIKATVSEWVEVDGNNIILI